MKFIYSPEDPYEGWYLEVTRIQPGKTFGELALMSSKPRAGTIQCWKDTQTANISK